MRLINADLLEKEIYKWMPKDQETWMDSDLPPIENLVVSIMMTIQEQPTVEAIPTKWLGEWALRRDNFFNYDFNSIIINQVLYDWQIEKRKKNETVCNGI